MGRGLVNAPRAPSVPARKVLETPNSESLKNLLMGSTVPGSVARNRWREIAVCSVRALDVRTAGFHSRI